MIGSEFSLLHSTLAIKKLYESCYKETRTKSLSRCVSIWSSGCPLLESKSLAQQKSITDNWT